MDGLKKTVAVVDYGMGNLRSVANALNFAAQGSDFEVLVTQDPAAIDAASRVVLPGQGAMPDCMAELARSGLQAAVLRAASSKPMFGVCVGMQMLLGHSDEGDTPGLGLFGGGVHKFALQGRLQADGSRFKVPQMGWNAVTQTPLAATGAAHPVWRGIADGSHFYFVHSYFAKPSDPRHTMGECDYGGPFTAALCRDNIVATQFHPEKSADQGLQLYRNFLQWAP